MVIDIQTHPNLYLIITVIIVFISKYFLRKRKSKKMIEKYKKCGLEIKKYKRKGNKILIKIQDGMSEENINKSLSSISEVENLKINKVIKIAYMTYKLEKVSLPKKATPQEGDIIKIGIGQDERGKDYFIKLFETGAIGILMRTGHGKTSFILSLILQAIGIFKKSKVKLIVTIIDYKQGVDFTYLEKNKNKFKNIEINIIPSNETDRILEHLEFLNKKAEEELKQRKIESVDLAYRLKNHNTHYITIFDEFERYLVTKGVDDQSLKDKINRMVKLINDGSAVFRASAINLFLISQTTKTTELPLQIHNFNLLLFSSLNKSQADFYGIDPEMLKQNQDLGKGKYIYKEDGKEIKVIRSIFFGTNEDLMKKL